MSRPKGSKNKKNVQLAFEPIGEDTTVSINPEYTGAISTENYILDEVISNMEITHALRTINQGNFAEIEHDMKIKFFDNGWRLFATHYVGQISEGIMILYILIREQ